ncbi:G2/M phase-specific E3 ubiquitin-protein ligase [Anabrus simplex]|uniref:G2/M phase-specific E3 ubiquitin-protein ligase n=1 Tax=Anabrus simplex TaxID=316456 RepID=UPI0035A28B11
MKPANEASVPQMPEMVPAASICSFCSRSTDNELLYGKLCSLNGITVHLHCLLLSSNMEQRGGDEEGIMGFLFEDILKEIKRGRRLACCYCKRTGATLGCCSIKCRRVFHFPCGMERGSLNQYYNTFRSYCSQHRPNQVIPVGQALAVDEDCICAICQEEVDREPNFNVIWAPCCSKNFHKLCLQQCALSSGYYYFKCPLCNNKPVFQDAMLENGIYIPERDASWELEPGAFQDLLVRYNRCDAQRCLCSRGREYHCEMTNWDLVVCGICGSHAIHVTCGGLRSHESYWECPECRSILHGGGSLPLQRTSRRLRRNGHHADRLHTPHVS